jgi:hypothetical protein
MSDPEESVPSADKKTADKPNKIAEEKTEDISDEAFEYESWDGDETEGKGYEPPSKDVVKEINDKTAEQLSKVEMKDEK